MSKKNGIALLREKCILDCDMDEPTATDVRQVLRHIQWVGGEIVDYLSQDIAITKPLLYRSIMASNSIQEILILSRTQYIELLSNGYVEVFFSQSFKGKALPGKFNKAAKCPIDTITRSLITEKGQKALEEWEKEEK